MRPGKRSLRQAITEHGGAIAEIARHFDVTRQTLYNWLDHYQMRGEVTAARSAMRAVAQDVIYERLISDDEDKRFESAKFVMLHLKDDGDLLGLSPETMQLLNQMGIAVGDVVQQFEAMVRAQAVNAGMLR